ncbi:hypothetical protein LCO01nite_15180 [Lapidilactobacillus concavus]|jgi:hypothetical protein|nr:hypothetical protein [Lapidilactobacillus concavus]GEL13969.1 hypothetical protein LCO01nite_15180 [Lapidilactobacillus concavus]
MWWSVFGMIIAALVVYVIGHHLWLRFRQISYQKQLDQQIRQVLPNLQAKIPQLIPESLTSSIPVSIWHRDVLIYEYMVQLRNTSSVTITAPALGIELNRAPALKARLIVTECWQRGDRFHFDVAYLINPETLEYVGDMAKIAEVDEAQAKEINNHKE